jgi:hypothetical protein
MAVAVWVRISVEIESNDLYPALNRKLPIQHGSGTKELRGKNGAEQTGRLLFTALGDRPVTRFLSLSLGFTSH